MAHARPRGNISLTEADNLKAFYERYPAAFENLRRRIGHRVRPSWIWQKESGTTPLSWYCIVQPRRRGRSPASLE
jgi:hypothetical protein